jgi:H+-transporting ATPase
MKMVTGDSVAIAREMAGKLGLGRNIQSAAMLFNGEGGRAPTDAGERIERSDGFAEVFPDAESAVGE